MVDPFRRGLRRGGFLEWGANPKPFSSSAQALETSYSFSTIQGARWDPVLPAVLRGDYRPIVWKNGDGTSQAIASIHVGLASVDGSRATTCDLAPNPVVSIPAKDQAIVTIRLPGGMPPNGYKGEVVVRDASGATIGRVPITWNVRDGALLPAFLILVGIVLGRLGRPPTLTPPAASPLRRAARFALGAEAPSDKPHLWLALAVQTVLYLPLLVWGFSTLYIGGSPTLGSGGVADYLPLLLWGFGATVLNKTLWNWIAA